jgi:hypothetical protein
VQGNRDNKAELTNYRSWVIFITRNLKGTNRSPGLIELDENPITLEERIEAIEDFSKKKQEVLLARWNYALVSYYGMAQIRTPNFFTSVTHCRLTDCKLALVDLKVLPFFPLSFQLD